MKRIQLENRTDLANEIPLEAPYLIFIDPSSACNLKCKFCMNDKIKDHQVMDFNLYRKIIDDLQEFEHPVKTIRLYGFGEPLMNPYFCDMVQYAKASDKVLAVDTTTNGFILNPVCNQELIDSGIDRINISINGMSDNQYKNFTGREVDFNKLVKDIEHLYSIKKKTIIFIKINGDYLSEKEKDLFFKIFTPISDGCSEEHIMSCWYDTEIENINPNVGVYGQPLNNVKICPYIFYAYTIHANGETSVCFLDWNKKMIIGDVRYQSIQEIWNGNKFKEFRINMLCGIKNDICARCDQLVRGMPVDIDVAAKNILRKIL